MRIFGWFKKEKKFERRKRGGFKDSLEASAFNADDDEDL